MEDNNKHTLRSNERMAALPMELQWLVHKFDKLVREPLENLPQIGMTLAIEFLQKNGNGDDHLDKHFIKCCDQLSDFFAAVSQDHVVAKSILDETGPAVRRKIYDDDMTKMLSMLTTVIIAAAVLQIRSFEAACEQLNSINEEKEQ